MVTPQTVYPSSFTTQLIGDLETNRKAGVVKYLKKADQKQTLEFLQRMKGEESKTWQETHRPIVTEVHVFIKYNSYNEKALKSFDTYADQMLKSVEEAIKKKASCHHTHVISLVNISETKKLEKYLKRLSQSELLSVFDKELNPFAHTLSIRTLKILEKYCPAKLREKLFLRQHGQSIIGYPSTLETIQFFFSRATDAKQIHALLEEKNGHRPILMLYENLTTGGCYLEIFEFVSPYITKEMLLSQLFFEDGNFISKKIKDVCYDFNSLIHFLNNVPEEVLDKVYELKIEKAEEIAPVEVELEVVEEDNDNKDTALQTEAAADSDDYDDDISETSDTTETSESEDGDSDLEKLAKGQKSLLLQLLLIKRNRQNTDFVALLIKKCPDEYLEALYFNVDISEKYINKDEEPELFKILAEGRQRLTQINEKSNSVTTEG